MAVLTDQDVIFIGSRKNDKQAIVAIPAQSAQDKPGLLCLQDVDDNGVVGEHYVWFDHLNVMRHNTSKPTNQDSDGTTVGTGVSTLDGAFDGGTFIDSASATGLGNCLRVGGAATLDKIEFYHDATDATIAAMAGDLYLAAAGGDINFSGDNIAGAGSITGTSADIVTGELTCGSINRAAGALTLEIAGTAEVSITSTTCTLGGSLDVNTTGEVTCGSINRASGSLTLEIAGTAVATIAAAAVTLAQNLDVNTTGEVTCGSINRASGSLTLEIAGTAEQTITATETTFGGNIILPSGGTITSAGTDVDFGAEDLVTTGNIHIDADGTVSVGRLKLGDAGTSYIEDDGSTLNFYDTTSGPYTLAQLATGTSLNPTVSGNLSVPGGSFILVHAAASTSFSVTNDTMVNSGEPMALFDAGALTDQTLLKIDAASITSGEYILCDRGGQDFAVKLHGEVEIAGADGSDMLTLTLGNVQVEDGKIEVDSDSDMGSHFITNFSSQSVSTLLVHNNDSTGTSKALEIIQDATGASTGVDLIHDGTGPAMYIHAATARTGHGIHILSTNQTAERLLYISGAAVAASDEGTVEINSSGNLAAGGNLLRVVSSGTNVAASFAVEILSSGNVAGSTDGAALRIDHTGTAGAGTVYAMWLNATADRALKIAAGQSDILGNVNFGLAGTGADVTFYSDTSGAHMWWDEDGNTNTGELIFIDTSIMFDQTNCDYRLDAASDALLLSAVNDHSSSEFTIGNTQTTNGLNLIWQSHTAGDLVTFDAGANTCTFGDVPITLTGADSSGILLTVTGIDQSLDSDSIVVTHQGAGAALKITTGEADSQGIEVVACASSVVSQILMDGVTNNWLGNDGVGMVHIKNDGTLAHANASNLLIAGSGSIAANARGSCLRIVETGANATDAFVAYIDSTNNDGLLINTGAVADINLKLTGLDAQVGSMIHVDGSTTNGWDGTDNVGCLHVNTKVLNDAGAAALFVDHAGQPASSAEGACARFIQSTGSAQTNAYLVQIDAIATGGALNVSSGHSIFDERVVFTAGQQSSPVAVTSSATKASAAVPVGTTFVAVTSSGTATHYVELPACVAGNVVWLYVGATGYELIANDSTTEYLNGQKSADSDDASSSVAANTLVRATCVDSTHWLANQFDTAGTESVLETATS